VAGLVSVIIPTYNGARTLARCLEALQRQEFQGPFEVLVVDDGSTDDTPEVCAGFAGVRCLRQPNRGPAVARNLGVREAKGELVVFTDADCEPEPDWLAEMVAPFADPEIVGVKGAYRSRQPELIARLVQLEYEDKYRRMAGYRYIDFIDTYAAAYRREVFLRYGGFDERYRTASVEDQEFSFRLAADGHKMVFNPRAVVWHRHVPGLSGYLRKKYKIGLWKSFLLRRHPGRVKGDSHTPGTLKLQVLLAPVIGLGAVGGLRYRALWWLSGAALLASLASSAPFARFAWGRDRQVALASPLVFLGRSVALALGLAAGVVKRPASEVKAQEGRGGAPEATPGHTRT
jgi:glycosyltransferase involved in cell wall biosynthesis